MKIKEKSQKFGVDYVKNITNRNTTVNIMTTNNLNSHFDGLYHETAN